MSAKDFKIRSILYPTDFTSGSIVSFCHALRIAVANRSSLHLLHVEVPGRRRDDAHFPRVRELAAEWKMAPSGVQPDEFEKLTGVSTKKTVLISSDAADGISSYAGEHSCDLLVMTTHGKSGLRRLFGGSVSEAAARATRAPTLFLRESHSGFVNRNTGEASLTRILLPVDGRTPVSRALELSTHLARSLGSEPQITSLHVGRERPTQDANYPNLKIRDGELVETIVACAGEMRADLIVMQTDGRDSALDSIIGSTTERVIHEAPCPVLAIPRSSLDDVNRERLFGR